MRSVSYKKIALPFFAALSLQAFALIKTSNKFALSTEKISLTNEGHNFVSRYTVGDKFRSSIRMIGKEEAKKWMKEFIRLSNNKAQQSEDFNDLNNFYNHIVTCDELLVALLGPPPPAPRIQANPVGQRGFPSGPQSDEIPRNMKEDLVKHLKGLTEDLSENISTLVAAKDQEKFKKLISLYREALKATLGLPIDQPL